METDTNHADAAIDILGQLTSISSIDSMQGMPVCLYM